MKEIKVLSPGFLTTVQDGGRPAMQHIGIPAGGYMDPLSAAVGNILVGNASDEAVLEMTFLGPKLEFTDCALIAVTGATMEVKLNDYLVEQYIPLLIQPGDVLSLGNITEGVRAYLAINGGFQTEKILGSRSVYLPLRMGKEDMKLQSGMKLPYPAYEDSPRLLRVTDSLLLNKELFADGDAVLRVLPGPQYDYFSKEQQADFFSARYLISDQSDRMGLRLTGPEIHSERGDMISDGIAAGSVQITAGGQPIIMAADRQPTGGYPKIAKVIKADLHKLAQLSPGRGVIFKEVTLEDSYQADQLIRKSLASLEKKYYDSSRWENIYRVYSRDNLYQVGLMEESGTDNQEQ